MIVAEALQWGIARLQKAGVKTPVLDAEVLLAHSAIPRNRGIDRAWLYAHGEKVLSRQAVPTYKQLITRRARREPVAYILGRKEFYGLDFLVNPVRGRGRNLRPTSNGTSRNVLVPRPESEALVEQALEEIRKWKIENRRLSVIDVGTGSGAIIVSIAKHFATRDPPSAVRYFATDISRAALNVARQNARRHGVGNKIKFLRGNVLQPVFRDCAIAQSRNSYLVVTANLPYLPTSEWKQAMPEVRVWEPRGALDGGKDGLKYYRKLFEQLHTFVVPANAGIHGSVLTKVGIKSGMTVLVELCPHQFPAFTKLVRRYFSKASARAVQDLSGRRRVAIVHIPQANDF